MYNILIVDDDDMMLKMAEFTLTQIPEYNVIKANSGLQIDLILLDIQMPGMDGIKVMELIQKHDYWNQIPVIFLTASSDKSTVMRAGKMGAIGYIKKPFVPEDLVQRVETSLQS